MARTAVVTRPAVVTRALVTAGSALSAVALGITAANDRVVRRPRASAVITERVSILIPARNEEQVIADSVRSALAQRDLLDFEVIVLDDGSRDATLSMVLAIEDPRLRVIRGTDANPPAGWLGKPWACERLAAEAAGDVLVFVDADVELSEHAVASCVQELRSADLALVAPYPRQLTDTPLGRLMQPLLTWSWMAMIPLSLAERRPSMSAANGQLLVFDASAYRNMGGHRVVADDVIEDVGLMRAIKASGGRAATVDGSELARCRMYRTDGELVDGYAKSLWSAFGGPAGTFAVHALLLTAFVAPPLAAVTSSDRRTRAIGALGYACAVVSRAIVAKDRRADALAHPASIAAFTALNAVSWSRHLRGTNTWKGRTIKARP